MDLSNMVRKYSKGALPEQILKQARIDDLYMVADMAEIILMKFIEEKGSSRFKQLVAYCKQVGIVTDRSLANIGRVKQSTANRWIHGQSVPTLAAQETILQRLAEHAVRRAENLTAGKSEDDGLDTL